MIWLRSTTTDTAPLADGFETVWVADGAKKVLACQLFRKKPCVLAMDGSVPVTIDPPGPVPTPVLTGLLLLLLFPPELFAGSFLHDCISVSAAAIIKVVFAVFFILFGSYLPAMFIIHGAAFFIAVMNDGV
jgi:hypothetical protein